MTITVKPFTAHGVLTAPPSKSGTHRALVAAALADSNTTVKNTLLSDDTAATARALTALGAEITFSDNTVAVSPTHKADRTAVLDCNESGTTARFMVPLAAYLAKEATVTGGGRLPERPFAPLTNALRANGTKISSDFVPMSISGGINPGVYEISGSVSSQFISALLLVLPLLDGDSEIRLTSPLASAPYVNMTLETMAKFGVTVDQVDTGYKIKGNQKYRSGGSVQVDGDWSSASALLVAGSLSEDGITLKGLNKASAQGDRRIAEFIRDCGADVSYTEDSVTVKRGTVSRGKMVYDASDTPDLVPAIAVAAAARVGVTEIVGAARLREKESDRLATVAAMLSALGGKVDITDDGLIIDGTGSLRGGHANGAGDHRIVMCAAVAATLCSEPVTITGAEAVSKSYPKFFEDLSSLGAEIEQ